MLARKHLFPEIRLDDKKQNNKIHNAICAFDIDRNYLDELANDINSSNAEINKVMERLTKNAFFLCAHFHAFSLNQ